jgi:hypothetical protein
MLYCVSNFPLTLVSYDFLIAKYAHIILLSVMHIYTPGSIKEDSDSVFWFFSTPGKTKPGQVSTSYDSPLKVLSKDMARCLFASLHKNTDQTERRHLHGYSPPSIIFLPSCQLVSRIDLVIIKSIWRRRARMSIVQRILYKMRHSPQRTASSPHLRILYRSD